MMLISVLARLRLPSRTVRLRLTVLYGGLFLASGAGLLASTYLLVEHQSAAGQFTSPSQAVRADRGDGSALPRSPVPGRHTTQGTAPTPPPGAWPAAGPGRGWVRLPTRDALNQLLTESEIALGMMAVVSVGLGWLVAGRVLRPLRTMTAATRQISEQNLHRRLALPGPRDELKDLGDTIDGLLARLESAFEAQRRFVANASHELRTPLAMMRTSLDVAVGKPEPVPPQVSVLAAKLCEGLDQAGRLLESLLVLARAQQGTATERTTVSLRDLVEAALEARSLAVTAKGITVRQITGGADVAGDETLFARMVDNVIDNAVRHNVPGGWIRVATEADGAVARLTVDSGGPILDQDQVRYLGQPFLRLGADRISTRDGTGLGLSIVTAIAASHGGTVGLTARSDGGLRVVIELPLRRQAVGVEVLA
jgi:signal transduction histidine kinase